MKKLLLSLLFAAVAVTSRAQGTFDFANTVNGVNEPVTRASDGAYIGSDFTASLFYGPNAGSLTLFGLADTIFFGTTGTGTPDTTGVGLFSLGPIALPGAASGTTVSVQIRVWQSAAGSYTNAATSGGTYLYGASNIIPITLGTTLSVPDMVGLTPFQVNVPEPTTVFLGGLGAVSLLLFRRRK